VLERGIVADLSIIKGWKADEAGNLIFRKTARNFNQPMATASKLTVAEVEEIVPVGSLDPDAIHVPGIYIKRLISARPTTRRSNSARYGSARRHDPSLPALAGFAARRCRSPARPKDARAERPRKAAAKAGARAGDRSPQLQGMQYLYGSAEAAA
jgi:hypothetical protein